MNLKNLRDYIGNVLDYNPNVTAYNTQINDMINEIYTNFYMTQAWTFCQKTLDVYTLPDAEQTDLTITVINSSATPGLFNHRIDGLAIAGIGRTYNFQNNHEGSYLDITGNTDNAGVYVIDKLDTTVANSDMYVSKVSSNRGHVNWAGVAGTYTVTGKAYQKYINLPRDCSQVISVGIRNNVEAGTNQTGPLIGLSRMQEEYDGWDTNDNVGSPVSFTTFDDTPNGFQDVTNFTPRAGKDFTVAEVVTPTTGWPLGTYEFKMAYEWHGIEGQLSDAVSMKITGVNKNPEFTTTDTTKFLNKGLRKRMYVRLVSVIGVDGLTYEEPFFRDMKAIYYASFPNTTTYGFVIEDKDTSTDWPQTSITLSTLDALTSIPRYYAPITTRKRLKLYPRPNVETPITIRYIPFPNRLDDDYDVPVSPVDTHLYIAYRSLQEALFKHGRSTEAVYYGQKADDELKKIEIKYLTQRSTLYIKQGIKSGLGRFRPRRSVSWSPGPDGL